MTDQVLILDPMNFKALYRRAYAQLEIANALDAKDCISKLRSIAKTGEDKKLVSELNVAYERKTTEERTFAKKIFENSECTCLIFRTFYHKTRKSRFR